MRLELRLNNMPLPSSVHQDGAMPEERDHDKLTTKGREHIDPGNFAIPEEKKFPIHDISHARNALARASGTPYESRVKAAVHKKYPSLAGEKKNSVKVTVDDMRKLCSSCADKMMKDGVKHFYLDMDKPGMGVPVPVDGEVFNKLREFALDFSSDSNTKDINGVEIFASGTWNGDAYTDKDLDTLVNAFKATKDSLKPYLKLGHSEDQTLLAEDSLPAAGWVKNIYRVGHKLLADFCDIPNKIADLIKARAYKRVSSEIFVNVNVNGKKYPYALKAVALLGGETPAVQTLDDIHALYALDEGVLAYATQAEVRAYQMDSAEIKEEYSMEVHVKDGSSAPAEDSQHPGRPAEKEDRKSVV